MATFSNNLSLTAKLLNSDAIVSAITSAFIQWAEEDVNDIHWREQFLERMWDYAGKTIRENPNARIKNAGEKRDIYDFGALYKSGVESFTLINSTGQLRASWHWDAKNSSGKEYAGYVHYGKGTNKTARPFTDDISIPSSFFLKKPGMALLARVSYAMSVL
jgi:hypothetical protein